jgi:BolA-like protein 3
MITTADFKVLLEPLEPTVVEATDCSDGCGLSFNLLVVSDQFEGLKTLKRHQKVNQLLRDIIKQLHAFTVTAKTVKEYGQ